MSTLLPSHAKIMDRFFCLTSAFSAPLRFVNNYSLHKKGVIEFATLILKQQFRHVFSMLLWLIFWFGIIAPSPAIAAPTIIPPTEVRVSLGNEANELKFFPNNLQFVTGKPYKLVLENPSPQKHYFTAKDFADGIWTQKVDAGKVEIKGAIHEIEVKPGGEAAWTFVPMKPGTYSLRCPIPGHTEAGMTGTIAIASP